jgi:hypothetical protein
MEFIAEVTSDEGGGGMASMGNSYSIPRIEFIKIECNSEEEYKHLLKKMFNDTRYYSTIRRISNIKEVK